MNPDCTKQQTKIYLTKCTGQFIMIHLDSLMCCNICNHHWQSLVIMAVSIICFVKASHIYPILYYTNNKCPSVFLWENDHLQFLHKFGGGRRPWQVILSQCAVNQSQWGKSSKTIGMTNTSHMGAYNTQIKLLYLSLGPCRLQQLRQRSFFSKANCSFPVLHCVPTKDLELLYRASTEIVWNAPFLHAPREALQAQLMYFKRTIVTLNWF